ncbi:LacI family DNA-binding transcriptional regulator [Gorillibacterium sp. sgz5001074]|uniref:LacI family DNA-binding transcriptional regulator n=1 Tax=Gorillibacterium sp. sgz5001074 TaxID=3446695 RepID=UPI003F661D7B
MTMKDVARLAGVSASTVSRVINDDPRISGETKTKVMACIHELDYKAHPIARSLKTNRTRTIGFLTPDISDPFFMGVAQGAEEELRKNGYSLLISCTGGCPEGERDRLHLLADRSVDGLIFIPSCPDGSHLVSVWPDSLPVVLADRLTDGIQADAVLVDNINGAYAAVEHILGLSLRRIALIGASDGLTPARERLDGYRRALKDYFIPGDDTLVRTGHPTAETGAKLYKELLRLPEPPDYVLVAHDDMFAGALQEAAVQRGGHRPVVPLAGFGDMRLAASMGLVDFGVRLPVADIGRRAARLIQSRLHEPREGAGFQIVRLKTSLLTGAAAGIRG